MALDPVLQQLVEQLPSVPPGPIDHPSLRRQAAAMIPLVVGPRGRIAVASIEDLEIAGEKAAVPLRIFRPAVEAAGTLHYIHGGGWAIGDLDTVDHTARRLCRDLSMVVVTSSYRLAPENPFPAAFDDSLAAARWVAGNLARLGGDAAPAIIGGDSAGGNLAAAICIAMRDGPEDVRPFDAQLLLYPAVDLAACDDDYLSRIRDADPTLRRASLALCVQDYAGEADPSDPRLSPLRAADLSGLPRALTVILSVDPLRDEAVAYADRLRDAGVQSELLEFDNLTHGFLHLAGIVPAAAEATDVVIARLRDLLSGDAISASISGASPGPQT